MATAGSSIRVRSPVIDSGPADATEAVVFVHGTPGSGRDWDGLIAQVSRGQVDRLYDAGKHRARNRKNERVLELIRMGGAA